MIAAPAIVDLTDGPLPGPTPATGWRLGLIGGPLLAHSLSPAMHNAALPRLGITGGYGLWPVEPAGLAALVASLRAGDVLGANVTVPHKEAAAALLDGISPLAARVGAVNTIVRRGDRLIGDNTDVHGFTTALAAVTGDLGGRTAVVLGAGGASRAVVIGLERLGLVEIVVANRNVARADALLAELDTAIGRAVPLDGAELAAALGGAAVVVNATALGWSPGETPLPADALAALPDDAHVTDLTYRDTDLLRAARARGLTTSDGLEMLILQGARALERWTGRPAPVDVMREAALAARH